MINTNRLAYITAKCYEENTAYFGKSVLFGTRNPQPSRLACQLSCKKYPSCKYWVYQKSKYRGVIGPCYLKPARLFVTDDMEYDSGTKDCILPEANGK